MHIDCMKKPKRSGARLVVETSGTQNAQVSEGANPFPMKVFSAEISSIQARPELPAQRHPAAPLNHNQHGVWV
jgi:hypothetical protein